MPPEGELDLRRKRFAKEFPDEYERTSRLERQLAERDADMKLAEWRSRGLPPIVLDRARAMLLGDEKVTVKFTEAGKETEKEVAVSFADFTDSLLRVGLVPMHPTKVDDEDPDVGDEPVDRLLAESRRRAEKKNISFSKAMSEVAKEHPDWHKAWRESRSEVRVEQER